MAELDIVIYQYAICPFCNKVKALLDFYDVAYHVTEVNPLTKKQISHVKDYRKVPIASIGGELVTDSPRIVEAIEAQITAAAGKKDANFFSEDAQAWTTFADKELAVLLFPNMTRSFNESYQAFSYVNAVPTFSYFLMMTTNSGAFVGSGELILSPPSGSEHAVDKVSNLALGSTAMWLAQGKLKKKYNIDNEREALFSAVRKFEAAIEGSTFLGGASPHMGDIAVFGVLRAIKDTQAFRDVLEQTKVGPWYERMADVLPRVHERAEVVRPRHHGHLRSVVHDLRVRVDALHVLPPQAIPVVLFDSPAIFYHRDELSHGCVDDGLRLDHGKQGALVVFGQKAIKIVPRYRTAGFIHRARHPALEQRRQVRQLVEKQKHKQKAKSKSKKQKAKAKSKSTCVSVRNAGASPIKRTFRLSAASDELEAASAAFLATSLVHVGGGSASETACAVALSWVESNSVACSKAERQYAFAALHFSARSVKFVPRRKSGTPITTAQGGAFCVRRRTAEELLSVPTSVRHAAKSARSAVFQLSPARRSPPDAPP
eukprot:scaffold4195_cov250-Pinguiococcus_pyrenoidosus.AAC.6